MKHPFLYIYPSILKLLAYKRLRQKHHLRVGLVNV